MGSVWINAASADLSADDQKTLLLFSGRDLWWHGISTHGGLLWSPKGLDREGFTLKILLGAGIYSTTSDTLDTARVVRGQANASFLPGWRFLQDHWTVSIFAGLDAQYNVTSEYLSSPPKTKFGIRGGFDLWGEPTPQTMIAADASLSSVGSSYSARMAFGWRLPHVFYIGPEIGGFSYDGNYTQYRIGLHATGLKASDFEWSIGFGWSVDSDDRDSLYGRMSVFVRK